MLDSFLGEIRAILGAHFRGMYLDGSLALGDFNPETSDIDFVVTTAAAVPDALFLDLRALHARFNAGVSPWATEVEAVYLPEDAFRRPDPENVPRLRIERGPEEMLVKGHSDSTWITHWYILREYPVVLAGPDPRTLIDPITPQELRRAMALLGDLWLTDLRRDPSRLTIRGPLTYTVLTCCRMLATLARGAVVSKPTAARRAQQVAEGRWHVLIERALAWRKDAPQEPVTGDERDDALALVTYTLDQCQSVKHTPTRR